MAILVPFDLISDLRRDLPPDDQLPPTAILTQHNLHLYGELMRQAREAIARGRYERFATETTTRMRELDEIGRADPAKR